MIMGLEKDGFPRERRDNHGSRNEMAIGLANALFSAIEVIAMGLNAMAIDLKKG